MPGQGISADFIRDIVLERMRAFAFLCESAYHTMAMVSIKDTPIRWRLSAGSVSLARFFPTRGNLMECGIVRGIWTAHNLEIDKVEAKYRGGGRTPHVEQHHRPEGRSQRNADDRRFRLDVVDA